MKLVFVVAFLSLVPHAKAETVRASYYGLGEKLPSRKTASGETFNPTAFTAASWTLPIGSVIQVCYERCAAFVRVNDRGPAKWTGRMLDLSLGAAVVIGLRKPGVDSVTIFRVDGSRAFIG